MRPLWVTSLLHLQQNFRFSASIDMTLSVTCTTILAEARSQPNPAAAPGCKEKKSDKSAAVRRICVENASGAADNHGLLQTGGSNDYSIFPRRDGSSVPPASPPTCVYRARSGDCRTHSRPQSDQIGRCPSRRSVYSLRIAGLLPN